MPFLLEFLTRTPIWVWFLLIVLLALGLSRTRSAPRAAASLMVPPVIFVTIAVLKLALAGFADLVVLGTLAGGLVAVGVIVALKPARTTHRLASGKLFIKGEWASLAVILTVFCVNYVSAVLSVTAPTLAHTTELVLATAAANGFSSFFMTGRTVAHFLAVRRPAAPAALPMVEA